MDPDSVQFDYTLFPQLWQAFFLPNAIDEFPHGCYTIIYTVSEPLQKVRTVNRVSKRHSQIVRVAFFAFPALLGLIFNYSLIGHNAHGRFLSMCVFILPPRQSAGSHTAAVSPAQNFISVWIGGNPIEDGGGLTQKVVPILSQGPVSAQKGADRRVNWRRSGAGRPRSSQNGSGDLHTIKIRRE